MQPAVYEFVWGVKNLAKTLTFTLLAPRTCGNQSVFAPLFKGKEQGRLAGLHGGSTRLDGI
ncbi:hypothetical protein RA27_09720 [Ruegeria sp. ANG-R]|nr:hypothetical protein RA27_09720 [Ruegeria sp. ANG-R]